MSQNRIVEIDPQNVGQAMQLVTEMLDMHVKQGWLEESEIEDRWMDAYEKFLRVIRDGEFVGLLGYQNYNQPIAVSLVHRSMAYEADRGLWEWFFVSPRMRKKGMFPVRLAAETIALARERGVGRFAMFIDARSSMMNKVAEFMGLRPVEIEYHATIDQLNPRLLEKADEQWRKKRKKTGGNGRCHGSRGTRTAPAERS